MRLWKHGLVARPTLIRGAPDVRIGRVRRLGLFILGVLACTSHLLGGRVCTVDGHLLEGNVTFSGGRVIVQPGIGAAKRLDPDEVLTIDFDAAPQNGPARGQLPPGWTSQDIGSVGLNGQAVCNDGVFDLRGAGGEIGQRLDALHFVHRRVQVRELEIVTRVVSIQNTHIDAKAGIMIRQDLQPDSSYVSLLIKPTGQVVLEMRDNRKREDRQPAPEARTIKDLPGKLPMWLRLRYTGKAWEAMISPDGQAWTSIGQTRTDMGERVYAGLAVTSRDTARLCAARFDQVSVRGQMEQPDASGRSVVLFGGGVLLRDGRVMAGAVARVRDDRVRIGRGRDAVDVPISKIASIIRQPLTSEARSRLIDGRTGVLMHNGDFLEGEILEIGSRVRLSSILHGIQMLDLDDLSLIVLAEAPQPQAAVVIEDVNGSIWIADELRIEGDRLVIEDDVAGVVRLEARDLSTVRAVGGRGVSLVAIKPQVRRLGLVIGEPMAAERRASGYGLPADGRGTDNVLSVAGNMALDFAVGGRYQSLLVSGGIAPGQAPVLPGQLVILGDGEELYRSPPMTSAEAPREIAIPLSGVRTLTLLVQPIDGQSLAPAGVWIEPMLIEVGR